MIFRCIKGEEINKDLLKERYQKAEKFGEIRMDEQYLFYRYLIRCKYIAFCQIERVYLKIESGEYGEFPVHEHTLILTDMNKKEWHMRIDHPEDAKAVLNNIREKHPEVRIGKENESSK